MNNNILNTGNQHFINKNLETDISSLLLKNPFLEGANIKEVIRQIESKKRCQKKLPLWFNTENIYYPYKLNIEQTSSENTARYKSDLVYGGSIADITGGFGVDAYFFSKKFDHVYYCEIDINLSEIVRHNFKVFNTNNISVLNQDGINFLKNSNLKFDWIYIDPSRRHNQKGKVFILKDCAPDIIENLKLFFSHSDSILIKTSPLLDLTIGINELKFVKEIHIVAVENEVKELLWILENKYRGGIDIKTINIKEKGNETFDFKIHEESELTASYSTPKAYLYEPNSAILKAGAFNVISAKFKLDKLHKHSHLYTSDQLINFPGRSFKIEKILPYSKKALKEAGIEKANVTTRNFPETVSQIRKKFMIKDGGDLYLFFTTDNDDKKVIFCTKT